MAADTVDGRSARSWTGTKLTARSSHLRIAFLLPFTSDKAQRCEHHPLCRLLRRPIKACRNRSPRRERDDVHPTTPASPEQMRELLASEPLLKRMDLIVGPAYTAQVPLATAFAREHRVRTLIPFTARVDDIGHNPYLFQFNPGAEAETEF